MLIKRLPWAEQPSDIVTPHERWLNLGLKSAYLLQPHLWTINLVTGRIGGTHVGTGVSFVGGKLRTPGTSGNGALLDHGVAINIAAPISMVVGCEHVSGSTDWGLLRNTANWYGWYSDATGAIKTANNNVFNGSLTLGGNGSVAFRHTSNADLTGSAGAGVSTDATTTLPTTVDRTQITLGYSRRSVSDAPAVADFTHFYVFNTALSDGALVELANEPWRLWEDRRIWVPVSVGGGGVTGTLTTTNASDTLAASGNQTNTGSLATTNTNDTLSATGNLVNTGTLATTNGDDSLAATGNLVNTGTLDATNGNDTLSAAGSSGNDVIGTLAATNANDTLAASGNQTNTGTLATTNTNDSLAASGNQTNTGTSSTTNANDTLAATGAAGTITGEANITEGRDTLSASGTATTPSTSVGGGGAGGGKREILHARRRKPVKSADEELKELLDGVIEGVISPAKPVVQATPKPVKEPVSLAKALASSIPSNITLAPAPVLRTEKQLLAEEEKAEMEALLHYFY